MMMLRVTEPYIVVEDFENGIGTWHATGSKFNTVDASISDDVVRFGNQALKLEYDFLGQQGTSGVYAQRDVKFEIPGDPEKMGMWIYGDGHKHWLRQSLVDANGQGFNIDFTSDYPNGVTWQGWKYVEADIPDNWVAPFSVNQAVRYMATKDEGKSAGTIYVDNIRAIYGESDEDVTNPTLTNFSPAEPATTNQPEISIVATDNDGGSGIDAERIFMKIDGKDVTPRFDALTGVVSYLPETPLAEGLHEVFVEVFDKEGNHKFDTMNFQVNAGGAAFTWGGPEEAYAGATFDVQLTMSKLSALSGAEVELAYDASLLELKDGDETKGGLQVKVADKWENTVRINEVNTEKGTIHLSFENLNAMAAEESEVLATLTFKLGLDAKGEAKVGLTNGFMTYVGSNEATPFFTESFSAPISQPLVLSLEGKSVGTSTTIKVTDQQGNPIEGAKVEIVNAQGKNLIKIMNDTTIYQGGSGVQGEAHQEAKAGTYMTYMNPPTGSFAFYRVYMPNGVARYFHVPAADAEKVDWNSLFAESDANGEIHTDYLTLSQVALSLQAAKGDLVSQVETFTPVPQLGTEKPENITLTWTNDPKTTQHVTWRTGTATKDSVLEVVEQASGFESDAVKRFEGTIEFYSDATSEMNIHHVEASGLTPGVTYQYRVGNGTKAGWSEVSTFTTESAAEDDPFSFLFFTDTQSENAAGFAIWTKLYELGLEKYPDTKFALHSGDIVEDGSRMNQWELFLHASKGLSKQIPFMSVVGNHDVYGDGESIYQSLFPYPQNGPAGKEGFVYSFDYGNAKFIMLNSEFGVQDMNEQQAWIREEVENSDKEWTIAMFHRPAYKSNPLTGTNATAQTFAPVLEEMGVDVVLNGHDHAYMRTHAMKDGQVQANGEGTVYVIGGSAGPKFYPVEDNEYVNVQYDTDKQVFTSIAIEGKQLKGEVYTIDNELVDSFVLGKQVEEEPVPEWQEPEITYNLKNYKTGKLIINKPSVSVTLDEASVIKNGIVFRGDYAEFHGAGFADKTITIKPKKAGAIIDFKGTTVQKVVIDGKNVAEIRGAENVQFELYKRSSGGRYHVYRFINARQRNINIIGTAEFKRYKNPPTFLLWTDFSHLLKSNLSFHQWRSRR